MQKNNNAMDIMIEDAKNTIQTWGGEMPDFVLLNSRLTFQMQMTPEATSYLSQGPEGTKRLKQGPNLNSYRGLSVINSRSFAMETGATPRDVLRRRVRVGEYYRIPWIEGVENRTFEFYDESKDAWQRFTWGDLFKMAQRPETNDEIDETGDYHYKISHIYTKLPGDAGYAGDPTATAAAYGGLLGTLNFGISKEYWEKVMIDENWVDDPITPMAAESTDAKFTGTYMGGSSVTKIPKMDAAEIGNLWEDGGDPIDFTINNATQRQYRAQMISDLKDFLIGNTRFLSSDKINFFQTLGFYNGKAKIETFLKKLFNPIKILGTGTSIDADIQPTPIDKYELVVIRPCIEHSMLGIIMGKGGIDPLGATLWGQVRTPAFARVLSNL